MVPDSWDKRYDQGEFVYGKLPNVFLKKILSILKKGSILFPCAGEGRNAVYACEQGWTVHAFDYSQMAQKKAQQLSHEQSVNIQYDVVDVVGYSNNFQFDALGLFFAHFPSAHQTSYYTKIIDSLKPGGKLIGELFSERQLKYQKKYNSGGPRNADMLLTVNKMKKLFPNIEFDFLEEQEVILKEGALHNGKASTIQFYGTK